MCMAHSASIDWTDIANLRAAIDVRVCLHDEYPSRHVFDLDLVEQLDKGTSKTIHAVYTVHVVGG